MSAVDNLSADAETSTHPVLVPLGDDTVDVEVLPVTEWRSRGLKALQSGDFETWAETCCSDDGYAAWCEVDPTLAQVEAFFTAWETATGESSGKSRASRRSSRSTARR